MSKLTVSQSMLKTYRRCHKAFDYKYRQNLQKRKKGAALARGICVHQMIEAKASGQDPWEAFEKYELENQPLFLEQDEEYAGMLDMITTIMEGYFAFYKNDELKPVKIGNKYAEHRFCVPLTKDIDLEGGIDMIVEHKSLGIGLEDHKTHKTLPTGDIAYSNVQSALYAWAMRQSDELPNPEYMVWNYIRWKEPTKPKLLKSGAMSKSVSDTTWKVYRRALIEAGLDPNDYKDVEEQLKGKENDFYVRQYLPLNNTIIENIKEDAISTANQILYDKGLSDRNITKDCTWCEFYPLCQAQLKGLDHKMIMDLEYQLREKKEEEPQESE